MDSRPLQALSELLTEEEIARLVTAIGLVRMYSEGNGAVTLELRHGGIYEAKPAFALRKLHEPVENSSNSG